MKTIKIKKFNNKRSETPFISRNGYSTLNNQSYLLKNNHTSIFGTIESNKDSSLTKYYKELFLNQVQLKLDERVYDLITKINDKKAFKEAKDKYDEAKKILINDVLKDKYDNSSKFLQDYNIMNLNNYENHKFSYKDKDSQLMYSFFNKLKNRKKKKVLKIKIKNQIVDLYQGNTAIYRKRKNQILEEKKRPEKKLDLRLLAKSNSEIQEYLKKYKNKKVLFDEDNKDKNDKENISFKRGYKKKKTYTDKKNISKINEFFSQLNRGNNRRKSMIFPISSDYIYNNLNSLNDSKKDIKKVNNQFNLLNINNKNQLNSLDNTDGNKNEQNKINKKNSIKDDIYIIEENKSITNEENKDNNTSINNKENKNINEKDKDNIEDNKDDENMYSNKYNINEDFSSNSSKKSISENNKEISINNNIKSNFHKIDLNKIKNRTRNRKKYEIDNNKKYSYLSNKYKNEILAELDDKEKGLTISTSKLDKSLKYFRNTKEDFKTIRTNKIRKKYNINSPVKNIGIMLNRVNENNSQFHFPIINKMLNKDKRGGCVLIDRIKYSLRHEYSEKLKQKKKNKYKEIDGYEIINKLNDQYTLEKIFELIEMIKKKEKK